MSIVTNNLKPHRKPNTTTPTASILLLLILTACFNVQTYITDSTTPNEIAPDQIPQESTINSPTDVTPTPTYTSTPAPQIATQANEPTEFPVENNNDNRGVFNAERAYQDIVYQVKLGPRTPGTIPHARTIDYITQQLIDAGWEVQLQNVTINGKSVKNIIASRDNFQENDKTEWIILGTHYDTRLNADRDPDDARKLQPVPGANDGASGVSILLELARVLPVQMGKNISLAFFDAEDNGRIQGWDWIMGSRAYVNSLKMYPNAVVVVDMVGDEDLDIFIEKNSDDNLVKSIWNTAASLGYIQNFIPVPKHSILDDHTPFLEKQIPALLIIDLDYEFWHTSQDTIDKVSADSLQVVGDVIYTWLTSSERQ